MLLASLVGCIVAGCTDRRASGSTAAGGSALPTPGITHYDSGGETWTRLVSERYLVTTLRRWDDPVRRYIVRETSDQRCCVHAERVSFTTLHLEGRLDSAATSPVLWRGTVEADDGEIEGEFYRARLLGCCDGSTAAIYYHLRTGGPLYVMSELTGTQLPRAGIPRSTVSRVIAFHDRYTPRDIPEQHGMPDLVGVLQYGPPEGPITRIAVRRAPGDTLLEMLRLHKLGFAGAGSDSIVAELELNAKRTEGSGALGGFAIHITFFTYHADPDELSLRIPVAGDSLDLARATLPRGLRFERLSAESRGH